MGIRNLFYYFRQAGKSIWRNKLLSFSTVLTMAISLSVVGVFAIFVINTSIFIESQSNKTQLAVYINSEYKVNQVEKIKKDLENIENVKEISYISKKEAMKKQLKKYGGEVQWKEVFGNENPLPYTYNITAKNSQDLESISLKAKQIKGVYKVDYAKELVAKLINTLDKVRFYGGIVILTLFISAIFLISTTIKLSVYAKRKEIMVMKYVGSSNSFIRGPFIAIGLILGATGSLLASFIVYIIYYNTIISTIKSVTFLQPYYDSMQIIIIIAGIILSGLFIGIVGSCISLRKYLRV